MSLTREEGRILLRLVSLNFTIAKENYFFGDILSLQYIDITENVSLHRQHLMYKGSSSAESYKSLRATGKVTDCPSLLCFTCPLCSQICFYNNHIFSDENWLSWMHFQKQVVFFIELKWVIFLIIYGRIYRRYSTGQTVQVQYVNYYTLLLCLWSCAMTWIRSHGEAAVNVK